MIFLCCEGILFVLVSPISGKLGLVGGCEVTMDRPGQRVGCSGCFLGLNWAICYGNAAFLRTLSFLGYFSGQIYWSEIGSFWSVDVDGGLSFGFGFWFCVGLGSVWLEGKIRIKRIKALWKLCMRSGSDREDRVC